MVAAALVGDAPLAGTLRGALGDEARTLVDAALAELQGKTGKFGHASAATAVSELTRRGLL